MIRLTDKDDDGPQMRLARKPFTKQVRLHLRAREGGTRAFKMRFSRPGTIWSVLRRPLKASDTHCSTLIGFNGMVFGSRPNFRARLCRKPGCQYSD